jgi:hypothetical protein
MSHDATVRLFLQFHNRHVAVVSKPSLSQLRLEGVESAELVTSFRYQPLPGDHLLPLPSVTSRRMGVALIGFARYRAPCRFEPVAEAGE